MMTQADNRKLRQQVHRAYTTRASDMGSDKLDNSENMARILELRAQMANILGFANYADYSLASKMANSTSEVIELLTSIAQKAQVVANKEMAALRQGQRVRHR